MSDTATSLKKPLKKTKHSIRFTVVSIFVLAVVVTAAVALSLQYYFTKSIAEESTAQLFNLKSQSTSDYLTSVDTRAEKVVLSLSHFPQLTDNINFDEKINPALVKVLTNNPNFYALYLGYPNGDLHEIINLDASPIVRKQLKANPWDRWVVVNVVGQGEERVRLYSYLDHNLNLRITRKSKSEYDASERPWFVNAKTAQVHKTDPYLFQNLQAPGRTYSVKLPEKDIVLAVDIALSTFSDYLTKHGTNSEGIKDREVYLFQKSGEIIASNMAEDQHSLQAISSQIKLSAEERKLVENAPILKVSNEMDWAPIDFTVSGQPQGYSIDTLKMISHMTGLKFEFINGFTWPELLLSFAEKDIDILQPVFRTAHNELIGEFSSPLLSLPFSLITSTNESSIQSMNELAGKTLAIPKGWSVISHVKANFPDINIIEVDSTKAVLEAVMAGTANAGLDNEAILKFTQEQYFIDNIRYQNNVDFLLSLDTDLYLVFSEQALPYSKIINKALSQFSSRQKETLAEKWLGDEGSEATNSGVVPYKELIELADNSTIHSQLLPIELNGINQYVMVSPADKDKKEFFATVIPQSVVLADITGKIKLSILITSICLILTLPVSWLFSGPIVRPIKLLAIENEKVAKRQYADVRLIDSSIKEIGDLAESFVVMAESIETYEKNQKELMEAFIKLIAQAIDDKSPYTAGHCNRVPELGLMLAEAASNSTDSAFKQFKFENEDQHREFRIAAWLHDCGKITTPEHIVDKGSKLETIYNRIHEVRMRFEVLWRDAEITYYQALIAEPENETSLKAKLESTQQQLQDDFTFIATSNVGGEFMDDKNVERLQSLAKQTWQRYFDDRIGLSPVEELNLSKETLSLPATEQLLSDKPEHIIERIHQPEYDPSFGIKVDVPEHLYNLGELYNLSIGRGTLTAEDRFKINEHIISTIKMLENLPFPEELSKVPRYASTHHETLKGTGYPRKLTGDDLSVPERVLVLADIFEALTAADRPYKKAKPLSVSVNILHKFALDEHIDIDLFELFLTSGAYLTYAKRYLKPEQIDEVDINKYLRTT